MALSFSSKLNIIVEYFIQKGYYNIFEIDEALFAYGPPLGTSSKRPNNRKISYTVAVSLNTTA
jgi:hypothetical protein